MDPSALRRLAATGHGGDTAAVHAALAAALGGGLRAEQVHVLPVAGGGAASTDAVAHRGGARPEPYRLTTAEAVAWVAANGRPLVVDAERAAAGLGPELSGRFGLAGALLAPLTVGDELRAVVALGGTAPRTWSAAEVEEAGAVLDVAGLALAAAEADALARHDPLTGCLNGPALSARLGEEVARARRNGSSLACVLYEIEDIAEVAERHGRPVADAVVRHVADVLLGQFRATDQVAHAGDGRFAVVVADAPAPQADMVAERALRLLRETRITTDAGDQELAVAMALTEWRDPDDAMGLLARAGAGLHAARAPRGG